VKYKSAERSWTNVIGAPRARFFGPRPHDFSFKSGTLPAPTRQRNGIPPKAKHFSALQPRYLRMPSF